MEITLYKSGYDMFPVMKYFEGVFLPQFCFHPIICDGCHVLPFKRRHQSAMSCRLYHRANVSVSRLGGMQEVEKKDNNV